MTFQKLTTTKNFKNGFQKKGRKMKKEDRQIEWKDNIGIYNGKKLFSILVFPLDGKIRLCLN